MTTPSAVTGHSTTNPSSRTRLVAGLTFLVAVGMPIAAILTADIRDVEIQPGLTDWIFVAIVAVVALAVFGLLVPWASRTPRRAGTSGLVLSLSALILSVMFFWTMAPVIFGSAGALLGHTARRANQSSGTRGAAATAAILVGAFAALGSIAAYIATS